MSISKNNPSLHTPLYFFNGSFLKRPYKTHQFLLEACAFFIVLASLIFISWGAAHLTAPLHSLTLSSISLDIWNLPTYALYTTVRMLVAVIFSFLFTLVYANLAAKNQKLEQILIPILDILQSVPVLGYISFTVTGFLTLFPHSMLGPELAVIFAIFTSQAWNMTFSLYQSLRSIPSEIKEAAFIYKLSSWQTFWKIELPFSMPGLIWNTMMSMSGGWFFIVAAEAISVGSQKIFLPGIGSYIALAIQKADIFSIIAALITMAMVIILYDQFLFRPLVAWADKFRYEFTMGQTPPHSWVLHLFQKSSLAHKILIPFRFISQFFLKTRLFNFASSTHLLSTSTPQERTLNVIWYSFLFLAGIGTFVYVIHFFYQGIGWQDVTDVIKFSLFTLLRVVILVILSSLLWVPIGVYVGLKPAWVQTVQPIAQFLASFPANLLFPIAVILISHYALDPNIWLSPLIILGAQWYILFNVIAGASIFPNDLQEVASSFKIKNWGWWRRVMLPGIFPYFLTGAITASGGAWNASIVAELVSWGSKTYCAEGLGSYIAQMTEKGNFHGIALGVGMMAFIVVVFNRLLWQPLYERAVRNFRFA